MILWVAATSTIAETADIADLLISACYFELGIITTVQ